MATIPRVATVATITGAAVVGLQTGLKVGNALNKNMDLNKDLESVIKNSPHADPNPERIPSPDNSFIHSPLENELTSPLKNY
jgi:hypothetical protein